MAGGNFAKCNRCGAPNPNYDPKKGSILLPYFCDEGTGCMVGMVTQAGPKFDQRPSGLFMPSGS